jgi:hypothetical protein
MSCLRCQSAGDGATCSAGPDSHGCCWWRGRRLRASARPAGFLCHVLLTETRRLAAAKNLPASRIGAAAWWCAECTCSCGCYHYYWADCTYMHTSPTAAPAIKAIILLSAVAHRRPRRARDPPTDKARRGWRRLHASPALECSTHGRHRSPAIRVPAPMRNVGGTLTISRNLLLVLQFCLT